MIHERSAIACPQCSKRYAIPAGSIGPEGRVVRCISCHHGWTAYPADVVRIPARPPAPSEPPGENATSTADAVEGELPADAGIRTETSAPVVEVEAPAATVVKAEGAAVPAEAPSSEETTGAAETVIPGIDDPAQHAVEDEEPRPPRRLKIVTALGALVAVAAVGGAGYVATQQGAREPSGAARLVIRIPNSPIRQRTADGQEIITTTAEVANDGSAPSRVPDLKATMRTPDGRVVKEWRVSPPPGQIAPSNSRNVQIGTTGMDVPPGPLTLDVDMVESRRR